MFSIYLLTPIPLFYRHVKDKSIINTFNNIFQNSLIYGINQIRNFSHRDFR